MGGYQRVADGPDRFTRGVLEPDDDVVASLLFENAADDLSVERRLDRMRQICRRETGGGGVPTVNADLDLHVIPDPDDDSLLTPEDVARRFQVPVSWVYGCCRPRAKSPMPRIKIGHYLRFEEEAVRAYIERQKKGLLAVDAVQLK
jgi:predicted DNA-binding transcriptional regulator AlpA